MHQSREMDWQRTSSVFTFVTCLILIAAAIGWMLWTFLPRPSHARELYAGEFDNIDPATRSWFKGVKAPSGVPCCDIADGHRVQEDLRGNSHWAFFEGQWREIPPEAVVYNAGNPTGEAVVWYVRQGPDAVYVRCFVPGGGV